MRATYAWCLSPPPGACSFIACVPGGCSPRALPPGLTSAAAPRLKARRYFAAKGRPVSFAIGRSGIGLNTSTSNGSPTRFPHTSSSVSSITNL